MREIVIKKNDAGQRIDKYIRKYMSEAPLSFIYKTFRKKDIKINGKWVNIDYILKENDVLKIYVNDSVIEEFYSQKPIELLKFNHEIIYEDENVLIVNKPAGLLVHGDEKEKRITLSNQVLSYLYQKGEYDPSKDVGFTPAPAHRLDRNTSGIVVFGKNIAALQSLLEMFKEKKYINKIYYALVIGNVKKNGVIETSLLKDQTTGIVKVVEKKTEGAKSAITKYYVKEKFGQYTLLEVQLLTGRTHQIRVHLSYIGFPLAGDAKYGNFKANKEFKEKFNYESQFLHAKSITFNQGIGVLQYLAGRTFEASLGKKEQNIINILSSDIKK